MSSLLVLDNHRLSESRRKAGLSQQVAATKAEIAISTLQNAEAGKSELRGSVVAFLARLYGVPLEQLFVHADDRTPDTDESGERHQESPAKTNGAPSMEVPVGATTGRTEAPPTQKG